MCRSGLKERLCRRMRKGSFGGRGGHDKWKVVIPHNMNIYFTRGGEGANTTAVASDSK